MRVLLTTDTIGGVWIFTRELTAGLLARGHHVALVSFGRPPSAEQQSTCDVFSGDYGPAFRFESSEAPLEWMQDNDRAYRDAAPLLKRVAVSFQPDLLHFSQYCFGSLALGLPTLITAHSDVLSWADACRPSGLEPSTWLEQYIELVEVGLASADAVVAPTEWMLSALKRNFRVPDWATTIANGRTLPRRRKPTARKLQAVTVGRLWDEAKNLELLSGSHLPVPVFIAGEQQHENAVAPKITPPVQALGPLTEPALFNLFDESSMYLALSRYEPFGLAPLEAALCGCAVLAHDIPSLREVWGDAALYFHDTSSLEALLQALKAYPEMLAAARHASYLRASQFTADRMTDAYVSLYETLTANPPVHSPYELTGQAR